MGIAGASSTSAAPIIEGTAVVGKHLARFVHTV
jgi:hypothetical protein